MNMTKKYLSIRLKALTTQLLLMHNEDKRMKNDSMLEYFLVGEITGYDDSKAAKK